MDIFQRTAKNAQITKNDQGPMPWVEKYRPKNMSEVASQEEAVAVLKRTIESANLPHLLFYGPPGTGKTSTILALAQELYGPENMKSRVLELNASDERGIEIVREKVKNFARIQVTNQTSSTTGNPCPPYKIVILDEADSMTADAQSALRRTMETYSKITRFCLICNYVSRIIEPLASRCAKFRFKPLDIASMQAKLKEVASAEGVKITEEGINALIEASEGDLRRGLQLMQSAHRLHPKKEITKDDVLEISGKVPQQVFTDLMKAAQTNSFRDIQKQVDTIVREGYSAAQVLSQLHDMIVEEGSLSNKQKAQITLQLSQTDKALIDGSDEQLQLLSLTCKMGQALASH